MHWIRPFSLMKLVQGSYDRTEEKYGGRVRECLRNLAREPRSFRPKNKRYQCRCCYMAIGLPGGE